MALEKIDKETAIKLILSDLKRGISKPTILSIIVEKCQVSTRTAERYYDAANKQYDVFLSKVTPIIEAKEIEALGEAAKIGILSKLERQKILSKIAKGKIPLTKHIVCDKVIQEVDIIPNWSDRVRAIAELNKMDGSYIINPDTENEFKGFEIDEV